jgi:hypothetical protein
MKWGTDAYRCLHTPSNFLILSPPRPGEQFITPGLENRSTKASDYWGIIQSVLSLCHEKPIWGKKRCKCYLFPEKWFSRLPAILIISILYWNSYYMHINAVRPNLGEISWPGQQNLGTVPELYLYDKAASIVVNQVRSTQSNILNTPSTMPNDSLWLQALFNPGTFSSDSPLMSFLIQLPKLGVCCEREGWCDRAPFRRLRRCFDDLLIVTHGNQCRSGSTMMLDLQDVL